MDLNKHVSDNKHHCHMFLYIHLDHSMDPMVLDQVVVDMVNQNLKQFPVIIVMVVKSDVSIVFDFHLLWYD